MNKNKAPILLSPHDQLKDDRLIQSLQEKYSHLSLEEKLINISAFFLGNPYVPGALGEDEKGIFDQSPLYQTDGFDCLTFVNTILALAFTQTLMDFQKKLIALSYLNNTVAYENRCHFMSLDWNKHNSTDTFIVEDVTGQIKDNQQPLAQTAETIIDKNAFFQHRTFSDLKLLKPVSSEKAQLLLTQLQQLASHTKPQSVKINYLPISRLLNQHQLNQPIVEQFPSVFVLEVVRPGWDLTQSIGTHLHVSHLGFCFKKNNFWTFRHASSQHKQVIDVPLEGYLNQYRDHQTIKGINIQKINFRSLDHLSFNA